MKYSAAEKYEIIQLVERSDLPVSKTLTHLDIHKSTFYNWLKRYRDDGIDGLEDMKPVVDPVWNKIPAVHRTAIIDLALSKPQLSPRELAVTQRKVTGFLWPGGSITETERMPNLVSSV